jgi:histidinol-phosphate/aromatic aminotransferase/cobyric acid decarboxylase-like protein
VLTIKPGDTIVVPTPTFPMFAVEASGFGGIVHFSSATD